jgi:AraC family transcriptional regulator of adaptative response / DNA-3-methyladenine glycosylase II
VARALLDGHVDFRAERTLEDFAARWVALPGIGPWTAQYIALRALGHPDAFPAEDLVLQRAVPADGSRLSAKALSAASQAWRPWRGYAVIHLWRDTMSHPLPAVVKPAQKAPRKTTASKRRSAASARATP